MHSNYETNIEMLLVDENNNIYLNLLDSLKYFVTVFPSRFVTIVEASRVSGGYGGVMCYVTCV